jgi:hypothetical protein
MLRGHGGLCLTLSVEKASVIILIQELACSKICFLRLNSRNFSQDGLKKLTQEEESFMTRQTGKSSTSATPPNKRLVDNTLHSEGEVCLSLSVGKASVMIFIEELGCSKICVLRLPRMLIYKQNTNKEMAIDFHSNAILGVTASCHRLSRG